MQELNFNLYNVIIATGIVHGFLFCAFVLAKKKFRTSLHVFLALTLASLAFSNLQYWFQDTRLSTTWPVLSSIYVQIELLIGPCFYFFVKSYLQKEVSSRELLLLLSPFTIGTFVQVYYNFNSFDGDIPHNINLILEYGTILMNLALAILIFYHIFKYERSNKYYELKKVIINTKWLKITLIIAIVLCFIWAISTNILRGYSSNPYGHYYSLWLGMTGLIYWMAYAGIFYSNIFKEQKVIRRSYAIVEETSTPSMAKQEDFTYQPQRKKKLNQDLYYKIELLVEQHKLYTNPQISLDLIAKKFSISPNYLSQLINNHSGQSFSDFINSKRIVLAKQFLVNPEFNKYTIHSIALETGFHSKSSFYSAFRKITGQTPTQFRACKKSV